MAITLEPVMLESSFGDSEGMLALRDGRLFAIISHLGALHGEHAGNWFVEAAFVGQLNVGEMYASPDDFLARAGSLMPDAAG